MQQTIALVEADPFPETVTESRWHQAWSEPVRVKPGIPAPAQSFVAFQPNPIIQMNWFRSWNEPVRTKARLPESAQMFINLPVAPDLGDKMPWFQALSEPKRFAKILHPSLNPYLALTMTNTIRHPTAFGYIYH